ncbi:Glucanosyltransferase-domain-containing protein [Lentinula raphanica]|nr:Glucanosyltransferase-domain-containing protein [Lentinula raphanica]
MARRSHHQIFTLYAAHKSRSTSLSDGFGFLYAFVDRDGNGNGIGSVPRLADDGCHRLWSRGEEEQKLLRIFYWSSGALIDRTFSVLDSSDRFSIKGIAYQEQGTVIPGADNSFLEPSTSIDPLSSSDGCSRDLPSLQKLGVNTIGVYSVNCLLNHYSCMSTFSGAGIYTIIDLVLLLNSSIDRDSLSWSTNLKAAARNIKAYLLILYPPQLLLVMPPLKVTQLSAFPWPTSCHAIPQTPIPRSLRSEQLAGYSVAAYFSEFGCITLPPCLFAEVGLLFSSQMSNVCSGGIIFSYFLTEITQSQFAMVNISSHGKTVTIGDDFSRLEAQYGNVTSPPNTPLQGSSSPSYPSCPGQNSSFTASTTLLAPTQVDKQEAVAMILEEMELLVCTVVSLRAVTLKFNSAYSICSTTSDRDYYYQEPAGPE